MVRAQRARIRRARPAENQEMMVYLRIRAMRVLALASAFALPVSAMAAPAEPVQVPGDQVAQLCGRVETINAAGGLPAHNLHAGQPVQILRAPLQGLDAVFLGPLTPAARVQVLLQFLGRQQQVEVDVNAIEPSTVLKRPRRTRGHGRRIGSYEQVAANL